MSQNITDGLFKKLRDDFDRGMNLLAADVARERARADGLIAVIDGARGLKEQKPYPSLNAIFDNRGYGDNRTPDAFQRKLDDLLAQDEAVREENEAVIVHNKALVAAAIEFCTRLGLPVNERVVNRKKAFGFETITARWLTGLQGIAPGAVAWSQVCSTREARLRDLAGWRAAAAAEEAQRKREVRAEAARREEEQRRIEVEARRLAATMALPARAQESESKLIGTTVPSIELLEIE